MKNINKNFILDDKNKITEDDKSNEADLEEEKELARGVIIRTLNLKGITKKEIDDRYEKIKAHDFIKS